MTTATQTLVLQTEYSNYTPFGGGTTTYSLAVWEGVDGTLRVQLSINGAVEATKTFRDCETQHYDSERWLNEKVGYPNQFAGILSGRAWEL